MSTKVDKQHRPSAEYPFFHYDPEGDGFVYFKTEADRDEAANIEIRNHLDNDGWSEDVANILVGKVTGRGKMVDISLPDGELDEDGCDEAGEWWDSDCDYKCDYKIKSLDFVCPSTELLKEAV
jgi:hypothetical protein